MYHFVRKVVLANDIHNIEIHIYGMWSKP
jgi:hypothetical protein